MFAFTKKVNKLKMLNTYNTHNALGSMHLHHKLANIPGWCSVHTEPKDTLHHCIEYLKTNITLLYLLATSIHGKCVLKNSNISLEGIQTKRFLRIMRLYFLYYILCKSIR